MKINSTSVPTYSNWLYYNIESTSLFRIVVYIVIFSSFCYSWSYEKALNFLEEKTFLDRKSLEMECKRYITIPGQACAYKVGEIKIKQLRQKATEALGIYL